MDGTIRFVGYVLAILLIGASLLWAAAEVVSCVRHPPVVLIRR